MHNLIKKWQQRLGIESWQIDLVPISDEQVVYPNDCEDEERFFVGVEIDFPTAKIYYARPITEEDIVHELLHIAHPDWSEDLVEMETNRLCYL